MYRYFIVILVFCSINLASSAIIKTCSNTRGDQNVTVTVANCAASDKTCILKRGTNATITIEFTPKTNLDTLYAHVYGVVMNFPVAFPLSEPNACGNSGLNCPLEAGMPQKYVKLLPVKSSYPALDVTVKWILNPKLKNPDTNDDIVCVLIPAHIK